MSATRRFLQADGQSVREGHAACFISPAPDLLLPAPGLGSPRADAESDADSGQDSPRLLPHRSCEMSRACHIAMMMPMMSLLSSWRAEVHTHLLKYLYIKLLVKA